ncbi:hypothetical protein V2A60_008672 [Cordyceps javanica]
MVDEANKPIVLALGLGDEEQKYLTTNVWAGLLTNLQAKASLKRATTTQEAESLMDQYPKPRGILITDPGIITTENKPVTQRVIRYVEAGGTAVFGAVFSSLIRPPDFDRYFEKSWSLPWKAGSYYRTTVILNRSSHGLPEFDLPESYSQKAVYVKNVPRTSPWYLGEVESDIIES